MKEELSNQNEKKKIKIKIVEDTETKKNNIPQENSDEKSQKNIKILLSNKSNQEKSTEELSLKQNTKKMSAFKITAIILIVLLITAIVVEIIVMVWLRISTDNLKNKNDKIPPVEESSYCLFID